MSNFEQILKLFNPEDKNNPKFQLLSGDASSRMYFRYNDGSKNYILTFYPENNSKAALDRYIYWQKKYTDQGIAVPELYAVDFKKQIVLQADIGNTMLQNVLGNTSIEKEKKYLSDAASILSKVRQINFKDHQGPLPVFNMEKLSFEINHSLKHYISSYLQKSNEVEELKKLWEPVLKKITTYPTVLCHRDYHSRNLMFNNNDNKIVVIDFQDSMLGPIQYDLCSLLDDCYLKYQPASYQSVMRNFFDQALSEKLVTPSFEEFFVQYHYVKLQRQFKAIGSFTYMWAEKNNVKYLKYISYVMESMKASFTSLDLPELASLKERVLKLYYEH